MHRRVVALRPGRDVALGGGLLARRPGGQRQQHDDGEQRRDDGACEDHQPRRRASGDRVASGRACGRTMGCPRTYRRHFLTTRVQPRVPVTAIDIVILVFAAFFALVGFARGFLIGALSLAGFAGGAYLGTRFGPQLLEEGNASPYAPLFGLLGALVGGVILSAGAEGIAGAAAVGHPLAGASRRSTALLGAPAGDRARARPRLARRASSPCRPPACASTRKTIQRSAILQGSTRPCRRIACSRRSPASTRSRASPARTSTSRRRAPRSRVIPTSRRPAARSCASVELLRARRGRLGLGRRRRLVVTNAHVVAGSGTLSVAAQRLGRPARCDRDRLRPATTTSRCCACRRSTAPPLDFAREVKVTEPGAVLGFPLNGPVPDPPGADRRDGPGARQQRLRDAARAAHVTQFRADVQPGNSGGPIVDVAGRVSGTVFSKLVGSCRGWLRGPQRRRARRAGRRARAGRYRSLRRVGRRRRSVGALPCAPCPSQRHSSSPRSHPSAVTSPACCRARFRSRRATSRAPSMS